MRSQAFVGVSEGQILMSVSLFDQVKSHSLSDVSAIFI
jgi:hypothetical protein